MKAWIKRPDGASGFWARGIFYTTDDWKPKAEISEDLRHDFSYENGVHLETGESFARCTKCGNLTTNQTRICGISDGRFALIKEGTKDDFRFAEMIDAWAKKGNLNT